MTSLTFTAQGRHTHLHSTHEDASAQREVKGQPKITQTISGREEYKSCPHILKHPWASHSILLTPNYENISSPYCAWCPVSSPLLCLLGPKALSSLWLWRIHCIFILFVLRLSVWSVQQKALLKRSLAGLPGSQREDCRPLSHISK